MVADRVHRGRAELRLHESRLDDDHVDAELTQFEPEGIAECLDRELGRVIETAARKGDLPAHRTDVDDAAFSLVAHPRQDHLGELCESEEVGLELPPRVVDRHRLDRTVKAVSRVVDQDADRAVFLLDGLDGGLCRRRIRYVKREQAASLGL